MSKIAPIAWVPPSQYVRPQASFVPQPGANVGLLFKQDPVPGQEDRQCYKCRQYGHMAASCTNPNTSPYVPHYSTGSPQPQQYQQAAEQTHPYQPQPAQPFGQQHIVCASCRGQWHGTDSCPTTIRKDKVLNHSCCEGAYVSIMNSSATADEKASIVRCVAELLKVNRHGKYHNTRIIPGSGCRFIDPQVSEQQSEVERV